VTGQKDVTPFFEGAIYQYVERSPDAIAMLPSRVTFEPAVAAPADCDAINAAESADHGSGVALTPDVLGYIGCKYFAHGAVGFGSHGFVALPFWLMLGGFALATFLYLMRPGLSGKIRNALSPLVKVLEAKYWMDHLWINGFADGGIKLGQIAWKRGDRGLIDGALVNGSAWIIDRVAAVSRHVQSGYLYHYAFAMIVGLIALMWLVGRWTAA